MNSDTSTSTPLKLAVARSKLLDVVSQLIRAGKADLTLLAAVTELYGVEDEILHSKS